MAVAPADKESTAESLEGVLLIGEEKTKIRVNKKLLASQSLYFDRLFYGDFREKYMGEIPIRDVDYEEFSKIIQMVNGFDAASLTDDELRSALQLADRFQLMTIMDKITIFILNPCSRFSIFQKFLISEQCNPIMMKELLAMKYTKAQLKDLSNSPELKQLLPESLGSIFKFCTNFFPCKSARFKRLKGRAVDKESATISMACKEWEKNQHEQFSPVHHIGGYPWRLRLFSNDKGKLEVALVCDKSMESEFWRCNATAQFNEPEEPNNNNVNIPKVLRSKELKFNSWKRKQCALYYLKEVIPGAVISVKVTTTKNGEIWRPSPNLTHPYPLDGTLVIGDEKKTMEVNKEVLCSQSPYFNRLFNVDFTLDHVDNVLIEDAEHEELSKIIQMAYGFDAKSLCEKGLLETLQLADRFELMEIVDKIVNCILSPSSPYSICQKIRISDQYNQKTLKDVLLSENSTQSMLKKLSSSPDLAQLWPETLVTLIKMSTKFF